MIVITGELDSKSNEKYKCNIFRDDQLFQAYIISNKREVNVLREGVLYIKSEYICDTLGQKIFSHGSFKYTDSNGDEVFKLYRSGALKSTTRLITPQGIDCKIPVRNIFDLPPLGLNIAVKGNNFRSKINDEKNFNIGLMLSYFCWMRQQIRIQSA